MIITRRETIYMQENNVETVVEVDMMPEAQIKVKW